LRVEVELTGNGQDTPLIYALRVWGPRFSYRDRYLPELYRDPAAPGADFLDRYLALFESVLTPLEDQVADAWRLTRPGTAPADALDWLASWIGLGLDQGLSEPQKRRLIREATALWRWRGTLVGLQRMLDVVTDDGVRRGDLVVVEHFRLRRTFATILGADLAPSEDPLTRGTAVSGNSLIGPTFYLGAPEQKEFFALFRPELLDDDPLTPPDERTRASAAVAELLEQYANRATVLVHGDAGDDHFNLIRRVVERECPAHVEPRVLRARRPLIVGLTSLLAVDSYVRPRPPRADVREESARFGQAFLTDAASLDPRIEGGHA
jgi:phage tail-like protein